MAESKISVKLEADGAAKFVSDLQKGESAVKKFQAAIKGISGNSSINTNGITGALSNLGSKLDSTAQKGQSFASKLGNAFKTIATGALLKIGSILVDLGVKFARFTFDKLKEGIQLIGDFGAKLNEFKAIAGNDVGAGQLKGFEKLFLSFGKQGVDGIEAASAANELLRGGISATIIKQGALQDTINLSKAGLIDQARAAEIVVNTLNSFGKEGLTTTQIVDHLTRAANASSTGINDLAVGMANATNGVINFRDQADLIAFARSSFSSTAAAGTGVKSFADNFIPKTKKAIEAQKKLGLFSSKTGSAFFDEKGEFIGAAKSAVLLEKATKGLTSEQRKLALNAAFTTKAEKLANALAGGGFADKQAQIASGTGASGIAAIQNQGLDASLKQVDASTKNVAESLRGVVEPALAGFIQNAVVPGIDALGKLSQKFFAADGLGGRFLAGLAPTADSVGKFFTDLGNGVDLKTAIENRIGKIDLGEIIKKALAGAKKIDFAQILSGLADGIPGVPGLKKSINEIGLALNDLVGLFADIGTRLTSTIQSIGPSLLTGLSQTLGGAAGVIRGIVKILSGIGKAISLAFKGDFSGAWATLKGAFEEGTGIGKAGADNFVSGILSVVTTLGAGIIQALTGVDVKPFVEKISRSFLALPIALDIAKQEMGKFFTGIGDAFKKFESGDFIGAGDAIGKAFGNIPDSVGRIKSEFQKELDKIDLEIAAPRIQGVQIGTNGIQSSISQISQSLAGIKIPAPNQDAFNKALDGIQTSLRMLGNGDPAKIPPPDSSEFKSAVAGLQQSVNLLEVSKPINLPPPQSAAFDSAIGTLKQSIQSIGTGTPPATIPAPITTAFTATIDQAKQQATGLSTTPIAPIVIPAPDTSSFAGATTAAQTTATQIKAAFTGISLTSEGAAIGVSLATGIRSQTGLVSAASRGLITSAKSAASGAAGGFQSVGAQIANGVAAGIRGSIGGVIAAAVAMVTQAKAAAQSSAGIHSPAREWRKDIGRNMGLGTGVGFVDSVKSVNRMISGGMQQMAFSAGRVNAPATISRSYSRTVNAGTNISNSNNRSMPITVVTAANSQDTLSSLALFAAMGQV